MKPIPYGRQTITDSDKEAVLSVLGGDFLTQGPTVDEFEAAMAQYLGASHAVAVTNGTAALHLAALALGVKPGDRVLVTPNTFVASANCIRYCGADVEFVDIDAKTYCLDLDQLEKKLAASKSGTYRGIVAVDFAGYPLDFERLRNIADQHGLWIIEDSCHALGAEFLDSKQQWRKAGSGRFADIAVFSFHPVKHIACGEGGLAVTAKSDLNDRLRSLRTHGITRDPKLMHEAHGGWYMEMQSLGFNYRISDILCALGLSQMKRMDENLRRRREIAQVYRDELAGTPLVLPNAEADSRARHAYHLYVVMCGNQNNQRKQLYDFLRANDVYAQVHYLPVYRHPYYQELYGKQSFAACDNYYSRCLSLPMYHGLEHASQEYVIETIKRFFKK